MGSHIWRFFLVMPKNEPGLEVKVLIDLAVIFAVTTKYELDFD